MQEVIN